MPLLSGEAHLSKHPQDSAAHIKRIANGDQTALTSLYDETCRIVFGLALRILGDRCAAEDVLTDVYVQVWRQAASYDERRGTPYTWLMTIARSRAIDRLRSDKAHQCVVPLDVAKDLMTTIPNPEENAAIREQQVVVRSALDALPPEQREVVVLAYFSGLSQSEIAIRLYQPLGTIKTRARLGMMRLREAFSPNLKMK
ncbi:MAG TPA: sigma-70 family RNA polymerase sigma factor [Blastocatellia bacterium]|nr:sigma-70 family RNA polymerase sigma factor [Blastocatellia bacterium]